MEAITPRPGSRSRVDRGAPRAGACPPARSTRWARSWTDPFVCGARHGPPFRPATMACDVPSVAYPGKLSATPATVPYAGRPGWASTAAPCSANGSGVDDARISTRSLPRRAPSPTGAIARPRTPEQQGTGQTMQLDADRLRRRSPAAPPASASRDRARAGGKAVSRSRCSTLNAERGRSGRGRDRRYLSARLT